MVRVGKVLTDAFQTLVADVGGDRVRGGQEQSVQMAEGDVVGVADHITRTDQGSALGGQA
ncbi:hypothetical protein SVIO_080880 [Streptomyces violaceusniger]|uniref:Uncharacterized protein n=1 Tax=Streptomyces violaceusniger TaxID=68280 RepID=A0A4D4L8N7_STRVO|nr:hypothetical protein SVIO_080880 [Streptomyces violaceusniger]